MTQSESFDQTHTITLVGPFTASSGAAGQTRASDARLKREVHPGEIIGGTYQLLSLLGHGGMGYVFRAKHTTMGSEYALKMLAPERLDAIAVARLEIEGKAIAKLDHPNIVKVYNMGLDQGISPFYVMDLLDGQSLADYIQDNQKIFFNQALAILSQIADGLSYAHKKGIVHRDIKPSNIVLLSGSAGLKAKIVDFGIAKLLPSANLESQSQTATGEIFGSPYYMSPEQSIGEAVDERSDIYSLGCTFFEMLAGVPPFKGVTTMQTILMHQNDAVPDLSALSDRESVPEVAQIMLERMLAKRPKDRYQSMAQLLHDILRVRDGKSIGKLAGAVEIEDAEDTEENLSYETQAKTAAKQKAKDWLLRLVLPVALIVVGIAAAAIIYDKINHNVTNENNGKITQKVIAPVETSTKSPLLKTDDTMDEITRIESLKSKADIAKAAASYAKIKEIKAKLVMHEGKLCRMLIFPDVSIGQVEYEGGAAITAKNTVYLPVNVPLKLKLGVDSESQYVATVPQIIDRIDVHLFQQLFIDRHGSLEISNALQNYKDGGVPGVLRRVARWPNLTEVRLRGIALNKETADALNNLKSLNKFHLAACNLISLDGSVFADQPFLKRMILLEFDEVYGLDDTLKTAGQSTKLKQINLFSCPVSPAQLLPLTFSKSIDAVMLTVVAPKKANEEQNERNEQYRKTRHVASFIPVLKKFGHPIDLFIEDGDLTIAEIHDLLASKDIETLFLSAEAYSKRRQALESMREPKLKFH